MPAPKKVQRKDVVAAAAELLREGGFGAVNARSVARRLGCSTQPIYLCFRNMDELRAALADFAAEAHARRVRELLRAPDGRDTRYGSYGLGFVRFAAQEPQLFRWLYLEGGQIGPRADDVLLPEILATIQEEYGYDAATARMFHKDMTYYSYGLAILANTGNLGLDDDALREAFRREFTALCAVYGPPPRRSDRQEKGEKNEKRD